MTPDVRPLWGHPLLDPDGNEIRVPQLAFGRLRLLGLLVKNHEYGLPQLSDRVYEFMHPDYESLMGGLRRLLGVELEGPEWVRCRCKSCRAKETFTMPKDVRLMQASASVGFRSAAPRPGLYQF